MKYNNLGTYQSWIVVRLDCAGLIVWNLGELVTDRGYDILWYRSSWKTRVHPALDAVDEGPAVLHVVVSLSDVLRFVLGSDFHTLRTERKMT